MEKTGIIYHWACANHTEATGYSHAQNVPFEDVFKIAEEIADKGFNVLIETYPSKTVRVIYIDTKRFQTR